MTIDYRIRNIVIAAVLAAAAVLLTVIYVTSARNDVTAGNENVTVYVPSKDYAVGTAGSEDRRQPRQADSQARTPRRKP